MKGPPPPTTRPPDPPPVWPTGLLCFRLDDVRYGLPAAAVQEVLPAVAITPLPGAPPVVEGLIDLRGRPTPVFDLRRRFGHPPRPLGLHDHLVVARAGRRQVALRTDTALDVLPLDPERVTPTAELTSTPHVAGVARLFDGLVLIHDLETFLSAAEAADLDAALSGPGGSPA